MVKKYNGKWRDEGNWCDSRWTMNPTHCKQFNLFSVAKVIETVASTSSNVPHISQKTLSTSSASIVVSTQQPLTMTTLATTVTPSSNPNLPTAVSSAPMKKQRPKTASPTRHGGPQQCQVTYPDCTFWFDDYCMTAVHWETMLMKAKLGNGDLKCPKFNLLHSGAMKSEEIWFPLKRRTERKKGK